MSAMDKLSEECKENECPTPKTSFKSMTNKSSFSTTPSSSHSGALKIRNFRDNLPTCPEKDLPAKTISELWEKPLKQQTLPTNLNSPKGRGKRRSTPSRKNIGLPPTQLKFDCLSDSEESPATQVVKQTRGCRRSLSMPTESTFEHETPYLYFPKRMKFLQEEKSPFEELSGESKENQFKFSESTSLTPGIKKLFLKSQSDSILSNNSIKKAVEKIGDNPNLIGDGSTNYVLPVKVDGKHQDLKEITCETLAKLMQGSPSEKLNFKIIDCRYPYEYSGGHIKGAINLYTKRQIQEKLIEPKTLLPSSESEIQEGREILIFHCEFSSQRGPTMCRHLRDCDRQHNLSTYPYLFYPELYVLFGGYKEFFNQYPHLCEPQNYVAMNAPEYKDKYRLYKSEAKSGKIRE